MGLFSFLTENGRGSLAVIAREKLTYEVGHKSLENFVLVDSNYSYHLFFPLLFYIVSIDSLAVIDFAPNLKGFQLCLPCLYCCTDSL